MKVQHLFLLLISLGFQEEKESIVREYIDARNNYDFEKVNQLVRPDYYEIFAPDKSMESKSLAQLKDQLLWGKEMSSQIKVVSLKADSETVIVIEEYTNYLDTALDRTPRKLKVTYHFKGDKVSHQGLDTIVGHSELVKQNGVKYEKFKSFCEQRELYPNNLGYNTEGAKHLRKMLDLYVKMKGGK